MLVINYVTYLCMLSTASKLLCTAPSLCTCTVVLAGYGFAWVGHFVVESNKPATFKYPVWSLVSDYRMFFLWLSGRLEPELEAAGVQAGTKQH